MTALFNAEEIICATNGVLESGMIDNAKGRLVWNVEEVRAGDWFIAVPSDFHDPHIHLKLAVDRGVRGLIVNRNRADHTTTQNQPLIAVPDTKTALLELVSFWRDKVAPTVVGVTGTTGRRATMVLLNQLVEHRYSTHVTFMRELGWFGCAKEVLAMPADTQLLIFEAGALECGDIARIGNTLKPDLAVMTTIRHPLPTNEREMFTASLYCELLGSLPEQPEDRLAAIIYDENGALRDRSYAVLGNLLAERFTQTGEGLARRVSPQELDELNEALTTLGIRASRADLWCAIEAAKALGIPTAELEELLELAPDEQRTNSSQVA